MLFGGEDHPRVEKHEGQSLGSGLGCRQFEPQRRIPPAVSEFLQLSKAFQLLGVSPADHAASMSRHVVDHGNPATFDPCDQCVLRHVQIRRQLTDQPFVFFQPARRRFWKLRFFGAAPPASSPGRSE